MSRPDRPSRQKSQCKRKTAYFSAEEALSAAKAVEAIGKLKRTDFGAYECPICWHFHWGHTPAWLPLEIPVQEIAE